MKKGKRVKKKNTNKKFIKIIFILILIVSILVLCYLAYNNYKSKKSNEEVQEFIEETPEVVEQEPEKSERMLKLEELQQQNPDIIGWLEIEDSNINYPVVQSKSNNNFYMTHNYKKEYSIDGSLFLDEKFDLDLPSTNYLIYGHNNRGSKEMFTGLMNYKKEDYYNTHKQIRFTTNREDATYEILAVFYSRVYYKSEKNVFRYYYFVNAKNETEYNDFVKNAKKASIYDTGVNATYGEQLLTLSTCEFSQEDGRFAIVAKKVQTE